MKLMNYMSLNLHPVRLSFFRDRSREFEEVFHAHQGMELLVVHEGSGMAVIGQQIFELAPGTVFAFRPFQLHRIRIHNLPHGRYVRSLFVLEPSVLDTALDAYPSLREFWRKLWKDPLAPQVCRGSAPEELEALFRSYRERLEDAEARGTERQLEEQLLFLTAFVHRLRADLEKSAAPGASAEPQDPPKPSSAAERILVWIEEHYMEPFVLGELAAAVHLSPNHVCAVFRKSIGSSITEYLTARRIRQSCWLLRTTDMPVQEIGRAVGFGSFSYFCQLFKKHVGLTPNTFRHEKPSARQ